MAFHKPLLFAAILLTALPLVACGTLAPAPAATPTPAPTLTPTPTITACTNPLFPVVNGATWTYSLSGMSSGTFTHSISAVRPDGFTDLEAFSNGLTRTGQWKCEAGALSALMPAESLSALIQFEDFSADYRTTGVIGVTLPAVLTPGTAWTQEFTIEGAQTVSGQEVPGTGHVTNSCIAADIETVTVPAGSFDAVRIGCQINGTISVSMLGFDVPTELASVATIWYARGVGMVKTENEITDIGHTSIQLTSYTIP